MNSVKSLAIAAAAAMLGGCLVSDGPLFDADGASAAPIAAGRYEACSEPPDNDEPECQVIGVTRLDDGSYEFLVEETDRIGVRFHALAGGDYAAQFADDDGEGYYYFWAKTVGETLTLAMIWCDDLPEELRQEMKDDGLIDVDERGSTCTALRPEAAVAAAAAYRDGAATPESVLRLTPLS